MNAPFLCGCALLFFATRPAFATTYHVAPDSSGDVLNIQAAIDAATSGDEILLSDGTFTGDGNWDLNFGTKDLVLRSVNGYGVTFIDCGFDNVHDIFHRGLVLEGGQTPATQIEGITFRRSAGPLDGGSIRCVGSSPVIRRVRFRDNRVWGRGGGVYVEAGSPTIEDCTFALNYSGVGDGPAIYGTQSWVSIQRCSFSLEGWGVVRLDGGTIVDCTFDHVSGNMDQFGCCVRATGSVSLLRCTIRRTFGVGVSVSSPGEAVIGSCLFEDNVGDSGAGVTCSGRTTIRNTTFRGNRSPFGAAAVACWGGGPGLTLDHCVFLNNTSGWMARSSAVEADCIQLDISHCTFVGNRNWGDGPAYRGSAITLLSVVNASIDNTIIAFCGQSGLPDGAIHCEGTPNDLVVHCTDIFGNEGGDWTGCLAAMENATGNLSGDPLFCDVANRDLSLHGNSPCAPEQAGECGLIGALGPWCGPLVVGKRSWGSIKAQYR